MLSRTDMKAAEEIVRRIKNKHCIFMKQMPMRTCTGRYLKIH
ncbi:hypothetical protein [Desulfotomaculum nigrificans]|nr:hypothetical protein [Desulfotomaculum nigrificans]